MYSKGMTEPICGLENVPPYCWLQQLVEIGTVAGYEVVGRLMSIDVDGPDIEAVLVHVVNDHVDQPVWINGHHIVTISPYLGIPDEDNLEGKLEELRVSAVELVGQVQDDGTDYEDDEAEELDLDDEDKG